MVLSTLFFVGGLVFCWRAGSPEKTGSAGPMQREVPVALKLLTQFKDIAAALFLWAVFICRSRYFTDARLCPAVQQETLEISAGACGLV